jgi:mevalonate kinase
MKTGIQTSFFSNGNLIISGEYFVLAGAKALAVPLKFGQGMKIECHINKQNTIIWKTNELGSLWFNAELNCDDLSLRKSSNLKVAQRLQRLLKAIRKLNPDIFNQDKSYDITCEIHFNMNWGWGSSSTLILNLACWAGIDPFELNKQVSSGSGYDIAASRSQVPVIYQLTNESQLTDQVSFNPPFKEYISFVYLGRKQNTGRSIAKNIELIKKNKNLIPAIDRLTEEIATGENMKEFVRNIAEHEKIVAATLNMTRIREKYFVDFEGEIKSLGAWGGDFAMVISPLELKNVKQYFKEKNLETIFRFDEIVKN